MTVSDAQQPRSGAAQQQRRADSVSNVIMALLAMA
jgi:hypothetical protein